MEAKNTTGIEGGGRGEGRIRGVKKEKSAGFGQGKENSKGEAVVEEGKKCKTEEARSGQARDRQGGEEGGEALVSFFVCGPFREAVWRHSECRGDSVLSSAGCVCVCGAAW